MSEIERRMEELKNQLNKLVVDIHSCSEEKVIEVSQELDKVIYEYITSKNIC